ncbi:MAG: RluA family pseudouridine synthase [Ruminococcaceae bacterium]|nr:RluA family pseudouridine synthase [Oscillospiraceae bacterium]
MRILFYDTHVIVCEKAAGELSEGEGTAALPALLAQAMAEAGEQTSVYPVHRLDRETVGVMVFARTREAAAALSAAMGTDAFAKEYLALCHGRPEEDAATLTDLLYFDRRRGKSFVVDRRRAGVKEAVLDYTCLRSAGDYTLLRVRLHTGRTHQIRVQFASRRHPLAGDRRYGAPKSEFSTVALAAHRLTFPHPVTGESMTFTAELPDWAAE